MAKVDTELIWTERFRLDDRRVVVVQSLPLSLPALMLHLFSREGSNIRYREGPAKALAPDGIVEPGGVTWG